MAVTSFVFLIPFGAAAADYILVIIDTSDQKRKTIYSIVVNYCDVKKFCAYYGNSNINLAIEKYMHNYLGITNPNLIKNGTQIKVPRVLLKANVSNVVKQKERAIKQTEFRSPLGGYKRPQLHNCSHNIGVTARICPFDKYYAERAGGRKHNALDVYCSQGTKLYPIKPGIVTGSGYYVKTSNGRVVRFKYWKKNGYSVKVQTNDGFTYLYIHCQKMGLPKIGEWVGYDTVMAFSGITGNANANNPHVHINLKKNGKLVDPLRFLSFLR